MFAFLLMTTGREACWTCLPTRVTTPLCDHRIRRVVSLLHCWWYRPRRGVIAITRKEVVLVRVIWQMMTRASYPGDCMYWYRRRVKIWSSQAQRDAFIIRLCIKCGPFVSMRVPMQEEGEPGTWGAVCKTRQSKELTATYCPDTIWSSC